MDPQVGAELEILWADDNEYYIEDKVEALVRLKSVTTKENVARIVEALKSPRSDFWIR